MEFNPYEPPVVAAPTLEEEQRRDRGTRPVGIWILSGLHLFVGLLFVAATAFFVFEFASGGENRSHLPFWFVIALSAFMATLGTTSSIGMWRGTKWGWWLATYYYVWTVLDVLSEKAFALWNSEQPIMTLLPEVLLRKAVPLGVCVLIILYLLKRSVCEFFRLELRRAYIALAVLALIATVVLAATAAITYWQIGA